MEALKQTERFKTFKRTEEKRVQDDLDNLAEYLRKLTPWIEYLYAETTKRVNSTLNQTQASSLELIKPGNTGKNQDGNFRISIETGGDVISEIRVSGVWTEADRIKAS